MDSMRSLNTSLPAPSSPRLQTTQPPEQLLQAFKTAALSVTNLYKTAASDQARARQAGYQDALDDLLVFLDKENLGLDDGEGWRVRQWATERLDGARPQPTNDSDDEREPEKRARSSSPVIHRKSSRDILQDRPVARSESPVRTESAPPAPILAPSVSQQNGIFAAPEAFTFRSSHPYPQDTAMDGLQDQDSSSTVSSSSNEQQSHPPTTSTSTPAVRLEVLPRHTRPGGRHGGHANRPTNRSSTSSTNLGSGAGFKRRLPFGEFFDIGGVGNGKDGSSGSKRGRFT